MHDVSQLRYVRHFLLLGAFAIGLIVVDRTIHPLALSFALYGVLHALALVLALRSRKSPLLKKLTFIAIAGSLSVLTLGIGLMGGRLIGLLPSGWGFPVLLGFSSMTGAWTYVLVIRTFWIPALTPLCMAAIAIACLLATVMAAQTLSLSALLGRWWLAVFWWSALSGGLCFCETRQRART
ncbi:MAG: hypothetical protein M3N50_05075 [Pseudomonadota bacterium]|nr:hypothetical protein [Pseudomonadota bacterium]